MIDEKMELDGLILNSAKQLNKLVLKRRKLRAEEEELDKLICTARWSLNNLEKRRELMTSLK